MNRSLRRLNVRDQTIRDYRKVDGRIWLSVCGWVGLPVHFRQGLRVSCLAGPYGILPQWVTMLHGWQRADQNGGAGDAQGPEHNPQRLIPISSIIYVTVPSLLGVFRGAGGQEWVHGHRSRDEAGGRGVGRTASLSTNAVEFFPLCLSIICNSSFEFSVHILWSFCCWDLCLLLLIC